MSDVRAYVTSTGDTEFYTEDGICWWYQSDAAKWSRWIDTCRDYGDEDYTTNLEFGIEIHWSHSLRHKPVGFTTNRDRKYWGSSHLSHAIVNATIYLERMKTPEVEFIELFSGTEWAPMGGKDNGRY